MENFDLNLIFVADSLYRTLNVSKTAKELNVTQSAVSHALNKLRYQFKDQLFVRIAKGVRPTELAKELRPEFEKIVAQARNMTRLRANFDHYKIKGVVRIATTDYAELLIVPGLINLFQKMAPGLTISIHPTGGQLPKYELENGIYDLAIAGFYNELPEGFYQQKLFSDVFMTAFRQNHSTINQYLNSRAFFESDHALITLQGDLKDKIYARTNGKKMARKIVLGTYSFTSLAWTISETDLVLTAPSLLLKKYSKYFPIRIQKCPVDISPITVKMIWHGLTNLDPAKIWIRAQIKKEIEKILNSTT